MRVTHNKPIAFVVLFLTIIASNGLYICSAHGDYDGYYNFIGNWPDEKDTIYSEDVQGLAHSDDAWFITQQGADGVVLYKIDVKEDLSNPQITSYVTPTSSGLASFGYTKFKAMDSMRSPINGMWYIFIGVEGVDVAGIAVYDEGLNYIGHDFLPQQSTAGWCAIDNAGKLYSGESEKGYLNRYILDWKTIAAGNFYLKFDGTVELKHSDGKPWKTPHFQGGDFTPEGDKLYIVTGYFGIDTYDHGIHVFDTTASSNVFTNLRKSTQSGLFEYKYDPTCPWPYIDSECEEPEGLTFWDLTDGRAPNIDGELHVLLLDNDHNDDIYIKHYTKGIYVNNEFSGNSTGDRLSPDKTVSDAVNRAFEDMEIRIEGGIYSEALTISKKLHLVNNEGIEAVRIGQQ